MKQKFLTLTVIAAMLFAACSKDSMPGDNGEVIDPKGEAWISLQVEGSLNTRAVHDPDQESGTADETTVKTVRAVFFDATGNVTADKVFTVGADAEAGNPNQPEGDAGKAFKVPAASKRILIIANPHADVPSTTKSTPAGTVASYADLNKALTTTVNGTGGVATAGNFMMTNAKGGLEPSNSAGAAVDLVLYNSAGKAENAPLHLAVDRVVAKVRVFWASAGSTAANISSQGWVLNATNKKYFPVSERRKTFFNTATPFDVYKLGSYREDPNYGTQPDAPATGNDWTAYNKEYNYYFNADAATITWKTTNGVAEYCHENTQTEANNMWAYTTQVLFKAIFSPKGLENPDASVYDDPTDNVNAGALTAGQDWLSVNGGFYTWNLLMKYIEKEVLYKYEMDSDAGVTPPVTNNTTISNAVNAYLTAVGLTPVTIAAKDTSVGTAAEQTKTVVDAFKALKAAVAAKGANKVGSVSYYVGGVTYYPIMIKHDDKSSDFNKLGEFGVVRNSVYDVNITSFNNPGYPIIPDPDPDTPDEDDENWLSIKIDVNPWTWFTQEEPL
ncbi:Mfa1 family fimbria major subunit [uncultured Alistipes sp.]|jgi:hypothetical protein|uniref:Mfa1 family fimbria major subunit n=1 Tax=uncultured Alistipes sp. TaxID=538949 RepID=UPI0025EA627B|nr:Mfa1 family fimbria major subunit [uncultured Alistipes sp.]